MDRRIQKSRQAIMDAFIALLIEKGFEKLTIRDIAERANVNRGTIYLHYIDKFDLLDKCIEVYVAQLLNHCDNSDDTELKKGAFLSVFTYLEKNFTMYKLLLSNEGAGYFRNRLYTTISQMITDVVFAQSESSNEAAIHFLTSGFIGIIEWWINDSMPCSVGEITEQLMLLLKPYTYHLNTESS